jgi:hypothetical protein
MSDKGGYSSSKCAPLLGSVGSYRPRYPATLRDVRETAKRSQSNRSLAQVSVRALDLDEHRG